MLASTRQRLFINVALRREGRHRLSSYISLPFFTDLLLLHAFDRDFRYYSAVNFSKIDSLDGFLRFIEVLLRIRRSIPFSHILDAFRPSAHTCLEARFPAEFASSLARSNASLDSKKILRVFHSTSCLRKNISASTASRQLGCREKRPIGRRPINAVSRDHRNWLINGVPNGKTGTRNSVIVRFAYSIALAVAAPVSPVCPLQQRFCSRLAILLIYYRE